jgi:hypothetical protein
MKQIDFILVENNQIDLNELLSFEIVHNQIWLFV